MKWIKGTICIYVDPVTYAVAKVIFRGETKYHYKLAFPKSDGLEVWPKHKAKSVLLPFDQAQHDALFNLSVTIRTAKREFEKHLLNIAKEG
jgi:hypothetical protein